MLHVILTILKILLWTILAVLGILLLLILLVLFSPIRYKLDVKYHDKAVVKGKVSFLIATVRFFFEQESKTLDYSVRLFGIKLNLGKEKKTKKPKKIKNSNEAVQQTVNQVPETDDEADVLHDGITDSVTANFSQEVLTDSIKADKLVDESTNSIEADGLPNKSTNPIEDGYDDFSDIEQFDLFDNDIDKDVPKEQQSVLGRIKAFFVGLKDKLLRIKEKLENFSPENIEQKIDSKVTKLKKTINRFKRFWDLKCTVKTRKYLKKYLISLVKHIGPRKVKGYVRYGFGDPCKTGQVTGYLSLLPFVYSKDLSLQPDFYEKIIDTELLIKGHIRLGYIIRIVLNINIWRTILVAKKIFKGNRNKEV